ncbi:MAG: S41 family peptidase [Patescibacteria group bacterium]|nr:S41 family peptidase [Patescibacteria group bacterium]
MFAEVGVSKENSTRSNINKLLSLIGFMVMAACIFSIGFVSGKLWGGTVGIDPQIYEITGDRANLDVTELDFNLFWQVWSDLSTNYVDTGLSEEDLYYGAIKGLVSGAKDPVTVFLTPEETIEYEKGNEGKFEGIGAELGYENGSVVVVAPLDGSPAEEAGIRAGDKIFKVDGENVMSESIFEIVARIRGDAGTDVVINVFHRSGTEAVDVTVTRGEITVPSVTFDGMDGDVAIIDLDRFTEASVTVWQTRWDSVVSDVAQNDPKGMVLDLRGNPGGYFNAAIWAAGEFLPQGSLVAKQSNRNGQETEFNVGREGRLLTLPLVVLVDEGSASASEILSGALQHNERAYIIGEETYGKGTAQEIVGYSDGSSMHLTTLKWLLPNGVWLNPEDVIVPDEIVEFSSDDFMDGEDPQMDRAMEYINSEL